jgi:CheY-like chemotaxis protein
VKFAARGTIHPQPLTAADDAKLRLNVVDTGPRISLEQLRRLFPDFEPRLEIVATRTAEGAGLGISISARFSALRGGHVCHDTNPAGGSSVLAPASSGVSSTMPAPRPEPETASAVSTEPAQASERTMQVLIADDVLMSRDIARPILLAASHTMTFADDGAEAVPSVSVTDFDVVLKGVHLSERDGLGATRRIRSLEGARGHMPSAALTAPASVGHVAECRKAGTDGHLPEPFDPCNPLAAVVRATAGGHRVASTLSLHRSRGVPW